MSGSCIQDVVRTLMDARGINVNQLAKAAGLSASTVYTFFRTDRRGRNVHHETLTKIAKGLDIPVCLLFEPEQDVARLLTAWSTLDDEGRETLLVVAASLSTSQR